MKNFTAVIYRGLERMLAESRQAGLGRHLEGVVADAFRADGWSIDRIDDADFVARRGEETFVVEVKATSRTTRSAAEAMLADAVLRAKRAARDRDARALAIVGAARISRRTAAELHAFARRFIEGSVAFGWVDARGMLELHGSPALEKIRRGARAAEPDKARARKHAAFSDLGQWIFKVLLAPSLPTELLTAPRLRPENTRHLARIAGVSEPTAHRVVTAAKEAGLVRDDTRGVELVDPMRLLYRWRREAAVSALEIAAKWLVRKREPAVALEKALARMRTKTRAPTPSACLGLFAAARAMDVGFVQGVPPHVLLRDPSREALDDLGLRDAGPREDVDVFVRQPAFPESTFRGCVRRGDLWLTDIIQTWLDTSWHPARGAEQAEHIERHVFSRAFGVEDR